MAPSPHGSREATPRGCGCDAAKLCAVHLYLKEHFPDHVLRDFHAPRRLAQAGVPTAQDEHHVVSIEGPTARPYSAVLLNDFLCGSLDEVRDRLLKWRVADVLRASCIAIVSKDGASAL